LYFIAEGIKNRPFNSDRVYGELPAGGLIDKEQARAELIQFLEGEPAPQVQYDSSTNMVKLTDHGLQWAQQVKDKQPYLEYRHLQN
jgi:hypothetical protein